MGLLDLIGGMGKADAAPWMQRLASGGVGSEGGLLQKFGGGAGAGLGGLGGGGLEDFLKRLMASGGQQLGQGADPWGQARTSDDPWTSWPGIRPIVPSQTPPAATGDPWSGMRDSGGLTDPWANMRRRR
jgi:hypothetical protein